MKLSEKFSEAKLEQIIVNAKSFENLFDDQYKSVLQKYLDQSYEGNQIVYYNQHDNKGRYYASEGMSLQNLKRCIRHTIAHDYYIDIDMVNAHPVILSNLCKKHDFECPTLDEYINDRDKCLTETGQDRDVAKKQYLILTNSENSEIEPSTNHMFKYSKEMQRLHEQFYALDKKTADNVAVERKKKGKKENHKAGYMNSLLCNRENEILMEMYKYFGKPCDAVLCFDGIMLRKGKTYDIDGCMIHIKKVLDIQIELKIKTMDEVLDLSKFKPVQAKQKMRLEYFSDINNLIGKIVHQEIVDKWMEKSIVPIVKGGAMCFVLNDENSKTMCSATDFNATMNNFNCYIINPSYDRQFAEENPKSKDIRAQKYLFSCMGKGGLQGNGYMAHMLGNGKTDLYHGIDYIPHLRSVKPKMPHRMYNIFDGFPMDDGEYVSSGMFENSKWFTHLKSEFFSDDGEFNHFLDAIADMIQDPAEIKGNAHLFYSPQGCGKGMLGTFMKKLMGKSNVSVFNNTDLYFTSRFNSDSVHKILKLFEEVSEKGVAFSNHNRLKAEITAEEERIEKKGIDPYSVSNSARYWFFSNNESSLYIENDDRRFTMHKINGRYAQNYEYFAPIAEELKDDDLIKSAFSFFATRKYEKINVLKAYETEYKNGEKLNNLTHGIKFIIKMIEDDMTASEVIENKTITIQQTDFNEKYKQYCDEAGFKYNAGSLKTQIKKIGLEPVRKQIDGERKMCIAFNLQDLENTIRDILKMKSWKYDIEGHGLIKTTELAEKIFIKKEEVEPKKIKCKKDPKMNTKKLRIV